MGVLLRRAEDTCGYRGSTATWLRDSCGSHCSGAGLFFGVEYEKGGQAIVPPATRFRANVGVDNLPLFLVAKCLYRIHAGGAPNPARRREGCDSTALALR